MPELAEVAHYARSLDQLCRDRMVESVTLHNQRDGGQKILPPELHPFVDELIGQQLCFQSAGKALLLKTKASSTPQLEFRLGMTGEFHLIQPAGKWRRHCFLEIEFNDRSIYYSDPRRFGRIIPAQPQPMAIAGYSRSRGFWTRDIKELPKGFLSQPRVTWLLGSGRLTGVGNYMANEALGLLKLSPFDPCRSESEAQRILQKCTAVAKIAFDLAKDSYKNGFYSMGVEGSSLSAFCRFYGNPKIPRQSFRGRPVYSKFVHCPET